MLFVLNGQVVTRRVDDLGDGFSLHVNLSHVFAFGDDMLLLDSYGASHRFDGQTFARLESAESARVCAALEGVDLRRRPWEALDELTRRTSVWVPCLADQLRHEHAFVRNGEPCTLRLEGEERVDLILDSGAGRRIALGSVDRNRRPITSAEYDAIRQR